MSLVEREDMKPTRAVLNQIRWERDVAISQLNDIGVGFGADMSKVKEAIEKQIPKNWIAEYMGEGDFAWKCPRCKEMFILLDGTPQDNNYNYCPNCGQSMAEQLNSQNQTLERK